MKYFLSFIILIGIFSCTTADSGNSNVKKPIGMPNPASKYCVDQGGQSISKKDEDGNSYGVCKFKDGTEIDEWEYFRQNHQN